MCVCTNFFEGPGILRPVAVDEDADTAGDEEEEERYNDSDEGHRTRQVREALAVDVEQQRHHTQSQQRGATSHHNAGGGERGYIKASKQVQLDQNL